VTRYEVDVVAVPLEIESHEIWVAVARSPIAAGKHRIQTTVAVEAVEDDPRVGESVDVRRGVLAVASIHMETQIVPELFEREKLNFPQRFNELLITKFRMWKIMTLGWSALGRLAWILPITATAMSTLSIAMRSLCAPSMVSLFALPLHFLVCVEKLV
jgi:hypothetical protein